MVIEFGTVITLIGAILAAAGWVVSRLEKIASEIATLRMEAKDFVTHEVCHRRRQECPCAEAFAELQRQGQKQK